MLVWVVDFVKSDAGSAAPPQGEGSAARGRRGGEWGTGRSPADQGTRRSRAGPGTGWRRTDLGTGRGAPWTEGRRLLRPWRGERSKDVGGEEAGVEGLGVSGHIAWGGA